MAQKYPWSFGYPEPDFYLKFGSQPDNPQPGKIPFPEKLWKGLTLHQSRRNWRRLQSLDYTLEMGLTPDFIKIVENLGKRFPESEAMKYLNMAIREGQLEIAEFLRNQDPRREKQIDPNAILEAGALGDLDMIKHFLYRFDINYQNLRGDSLLSLTIDHHDTEMLKLLLDRQLSDVNLDVNLLNHHRKTPLMVAIEKGYLDIVELLLEQPEINIEYVNDHDESAYSLAEASEYKDRLFKMLDEVRKRQRSSSPPRRRRGRF